jgi:hypothetical protein
MGPVMSVGYDRTRGASAASAIGRGDLVLKGLLRLPPMLKLKQFCLNRPCNFDVMVDRGFGKDITGKNITGPRLEA